MPWIDETVFSLWYILASFVVDCCCCCCCQVASVVSDSVRPHRRQPTRLRRPWDSPSKNTGVGCHLLLLIAIHGVAESWTQLSDWSDLIWSTNWPYITADSECSYEIKTSLLLGRKALTNLDSILKSKEITLPTKVCIGKDVFLPILMCSCEHRIAECRRVTTFKLSYWRKLLRVPWNARRLNQSIIKEINPEYSLEGLMLKLKLQYFGQLTRRASSLKKTLILGKNEGKRRRGQQRMRD